MQLKQLSISLLLLSSGTFSVDSLADTFPYLPKASLTGMWGDQSVGQAEVLMPLLGDNTQLWYGALQGRYSENNSWSGSIGTGYRYLHNNAIWGAFVLADRNNGSMGHQFWDISPGIERLGSSWDLRVSGYLPISNKRWQGAWQAANELGINDYVHFSGHSLSDRLAAPVEEAAKGIEAEVGYHVNQLPGLIVAGGLYHYHYQDADNTTGIGARIDYPLTPMLNLTLKNSYDKTQGNQFVAGIRLSFGGAQDHSLSKRLTDDIQRGMGALNNGTLLPTAKGLKISSQNQQIANNIWFFAPGVGQSNALADGTYEHPFQGLTQSAIHSAGENTQLFIKTGDYAWQDSLELLSGQHLQGRTEDYSLAASDKLPLFYGQMALMNSNDVMLENIGFIDNSSSNHSTLTIDNANRVTLKHVNFLRNAYSAVSAVQLSKSRQVEFDDVDIAVHADGGLFVQAKGIITANSELSLNHSHILVQAKAAYGISNATGIDISGVDNHLTIKNSAIDTDSQAAQIAVARGLYGNAQPTAASLATILIDNSRISSNANSLISAYANAISINNQQFNASIVHSTLEAQAHSQKYAQSMGLLFSSLAGSDNNLLLEDVTINSMAEGRDSYSAKGLEIGAVYSNLALTVKDSHIKAQALSIGTPEAEDSAMATGISILSRAQKAVISGNTIEVDANSKYGLAAAYGINGNQGRGLQEVAESSMLITDNTFLTQANSAYNNAISIGLNLHDLAAKITHNTIMSDANGISAEISQAVGISSAIGQDIADDNIFELTGHSTHIKLKNVPLLT